MLSPHKIFKNTLKYAGIENVDGADSQYVLLKEFNGFAALVMIFWFFCAVGIASVILIFSVALIEEWTFLEEIIIFFMVISFFSLIGIGRAFIRRCFRLKTFKLFPDGSISNDDTHEHFHVKNIVTIKKRFFSTVVSFNSGESYTFGELAHKKLAIIKNKLTQEEQT